MKPVTLKFFLNSVALAAAGLSGPVFAHEGHGDSVLHALMHLLQVPDHRLFVAIAGVAVFAAWRFFKGEKK